MFVDRSPDTNVLCRLEQKQMLFSIISGQQTILRHFSDAYFNVFIISCSRSKSVMLTTNPFDRENDDPIVVLKINKALSMGYDYEFIQSVLQQQSHDQDMSKFIETIVRTAEEMNKQSNELSPMGKQENDDSSQLSYDVFIIDGADLALRYFL